MMGPMLGQAYSGLSMPTCVQLLSEHPRACKQAAALKRPRTIICLPAQPHPAPSIMIMSGAASEARFLSAGHRGAHGGHGRPRDHAGRGDRPQGRSHQGSLQQHCGAAPHCSRGAGHHAPPHPPDTMWAHQSLRPPGRAGLQLAPVRPQRYTADCCTTLVAGLGFGKTPVACRRAWGKRGYQQLLCRGFVWKAQLSRMSSGVLPGPKLQPVVAWRLATPPSLVSVAALVRS